MRMNDIMGMSWDDINKLSLSDLRKATRTLADVANKRYQRLQNQKNPLRATQAQRQMTESGGRITTKGKNINQLRNELGRARAFLSMKTSTVKGAADVAKNRAIDVFGEDFLKNKNLSAEKKAEMLKKVDELWDKFNEKNPAAKTIVPSKSLREYIAELVKDNPDQNIDVLLEKADQYLQGEYEKTQAGAPDESDDFDDADEYEY